ncbi:hypothetical protein [Massilia sp. Mn16-1_5]|uniref:hypothetical protein n=1 Tax=Massilia sp. Mn16-1_5 TaxID=2079199 RepID=UPI00109E5037|nr:hypothetical protein [Massilia sp. Mn16-1_5]THC39235.1 hypothetical protein C2862_24345 [Massilia sp. Mn16-1_5]
MDTRYRRAARRVVTALLLAAGLGGCVYAPPYAAYDPYYPTYGYPTYVGPPVTLDFGFGYYRHNHSYHGHRGYYGGHGRHGWGHGGRRR